MASGRYLTSGVSKVIFAPAIANKAAPSRVELTAGTILTQPSVDVVEGLVELTGFETTPSNITTPDVASRFDKTIPGRTASTDAAATFYDDVDPINDNIRSDLAEGTNGFIVIMYRGDVPTETCEVWPVRVSSNNSSQVTSANEAATYTVGFGITGQPEKNAVIPALT